VTAIGSGFAESGVHTYAQPGSYAATVQIRDTGGATAIVSSTISVAACAAPSIPSSAYARAVLADAPLGYWRLDDGGVCVADSSGHGLTGASNRGISHGQPRAPLSGDNDTSMFFDGSSGYISLGDPAAIVRKRLYGYNLYLNPDGTPGFGIDDQNATPYSAGSPAAVTDGKWHHLVGTYDGKQVCLYVDGQQAACQAAGSIYYQPDLVAIGRDGGYSGSYFNGRIDEVTIYGTALSAAQVQAHYLAAIPRPTTTFLGAPGSSVYGQPITLRAIVRCAGTPTGTITFKEGATVLGTAALTSADTATFTANVLAAGAHSITAVYTGSSTSAVLAQTIQ
jgi:hypothetical protein